MMPLKTEVGIQLLSVVGAPLRRHLELVDVEVGVDMSKEMERLYTKISKTRAAHELSSDDTLNDIFVLEKYVQLFGEYGCMWRQIAAAQFSQSWDSLQNSFDIIRLIRRLSSLDVSAIENQLYALETAYPYKVFFSIGAIVDRFECSICGKDIDSLDCAHRRGGLYRGEMARGVARNIVQVDHVAMVEYPVDKRCVVTYENDAPQFNLVRFIGRLLRDRKLLASRFGGISWQKREVANPKHRCVGRNDPCYCGSGRKFKICCIDQAFIEQDHAEVFQARSIIERAGAYGKAENSQPGQVEVGRVSWTG